MCELSIVLLLFIILFGSFLKLMYDWKREVVVVSESFHKHTKAKNAESNSFSFEFNIDLAIYMGEIITINGNTTSNKINN